MKYPFTLKNQVLWRALRFSWFFENNFICEFCIFQTLCVIRGGGLTSINNTKNSFERTIFHFGGRGLRPFSYLRLWTRYWSLSFDLLLSKWRCGSESPQSPVHKIWFHQCLRCKLRYVLVTGQYRSQNVAVFPYLCGWTWLQQRGISESSPNGETR